MKIKEWIAHVEQSIDNLLHRGEMVMLLAPTGGTSASQHDLTDSIANYRFLLIGSRQYGSMERLSRWNAQPMITTPEWFRSTNTVSNYGDTVYGCGSVAWISDTKVEVLNSQGHQYMVIFGIK